MLLNECEPIKRGCGQIYLPVSTTPISIAPTTSRRRRLVFRGRILHPTVTHAEIYRQAAHAEFNLLLSERFYARAKCGLIAHRKLPCIICIRRRAAPA
jgi:hypothetical protein